MPLTNAGQLGFTSAPQGVVIVHVPRIPVHEPIVLNVNAQPTVPATPGTQAPPTLG
jgi:hypothetical protein